jgi:uncharacterized protein (DUF1015 family)
LPDVRPFRGWRYDTSIAGPLESLICPPYDVISAEAAASLLNRNPHNAILLELGPGTAQPDAPDSRYRRSGSELQRWVDQGILRQDDEPALYVYEQDFAREGRRMRRRALLAAVRLTPWSSGDVLPHEHTLSSPKADRLALLDATRTNISPIFALCDGNLSAVKSVLAQADAAPPVIEATEENGDVHRLWAVTEARLIVRTSNELRERPLYIADGHHRYETALAFAQMSPDAAGPDGSAYVLMAITPVDDPGLVVLPTHRLLRCVEEEHLDYALACLHEYFDVAIVHNVPPAQQLIDALAAANDRMAIGLYTAGLARVLTPRPATAELMTGVHPALREFDVSALHAVIFAHLVGLTADDLSRQTYIEYTRAADEALSRVDDEMDQAAFVLQGLPPEVIVRVARAGTTMPQKSTYFYPKLATGMVLRRLCS